MEGAWGKLAPGMAVEEAIDATLVNGVLDRRFKGTLDFGDGGDLALGRPGEKRLEEGAFLCQAQILMAPPASPRRFHRRHAEPIVGGNDPAHGRERGPGMGSNVVGFARGNQRLINNQPPLAAPKAGISGHPPFHLFSWQVSSGSGHAASHRWLSFPSLAPFYYTTWCANWYEKLCLKISNHAFCVVF
jgi:hypothetical protein